MSRSTSGWSGNPTASDASLLTDLLRIGCIAGHRQHRRLTRWSAAQHQRRHPGRASGGRHRRQPADHRGRDGRCPRRDGRSHSDAVARRDRRDDRFGRGALGDGRKAHRLSRRATRGRARSGDRRRAAAVNDFESAVGTVICRELVTTDNPGAADDMTTTTDVIANETEHLLQVYRRGQVVFERGAAAASSTRTGVAISI